MTAVREHDNTRPDPFPLQPTLARHEVDDVSDIYRSGPVPEIEQPARSTTPNSSATSSSSLFGGRLGAFANVVEQAISRWARTGSSSSSSSSSSSNSSSASARTTSRSFRAKRRRNASEIDINARISKIKAREEKRQIPRSFGLYLPPSLAAKTEGSERILWTSSLDIIISRLETALKTSIKARRQYDRQRQTDSKKDANPRPPITVPDFLKAPSRAASFTDLAAAGLTKSRKGKDKEESSRPSTVKLPNPWFLDVASPTWNDLLVIGKLLHLHPLTLEDILQQDPREKLELFPKLGYYFISFRAIESQKSHKLHEQYFSMGDQELHEGTVGESNVYLVVFKEGVCVFHFTDISEHTNHVRNRILSFEEVLSLSSDWIAHSILDSIVDSFFPYLSEIEKQVMTIENLVLIGDSGMQESRPTQPNGGSEESTEDSEMTAVASEKQPIEPSEKADILPLNEKNLALLSYRDKQTQFLVPRRPWPVVFRRFRRFMAKHWRTAQTIVEGQSTPSPTQLTLRRMARTRRLVTTLTRLLASKSEVVARVQKRLLTSQRMGPGKDTADDLEVAIYFGDVQDHILTLQNSLQHFERMLSQSHPTYLNQLRTTASLTKGDTDRALIFLTVVSMGVLVCQGVLGIFSMNIHVPQNRKRDEDDPDFNGPFKYNVFGIVIALVMTVLSAYLYQVRRWWLQAKRRRDAQL